LGCRTSTSNKEATEDCDVTIIAVKPDVVTRVLKEINPLVSSRGPLIVSSAMGITLATMENCLPPNSRVARIMPNTPATVGEGASVYILGAGATSEDAATIETLLQCIGQFSPVASEATLDAVTGFSGAGPAFAFAIIDALADGGVNVGLPRPLAIKFAAQVLLGSSKMVLTGSDHPAALKDAVCSPAGCSIAGLAALEKAGVRGGLIAAVEAAANKASTTK